MVSGAPSIRAVNCGCEVDMGLLCRRDRLPAPSPITALGRSSLLPSLTGTLFSAPVYKTYGAIIADEKYEPAGFKMALGFKDLRLALNAAESLQVPMPIASLVRDRFITSLARGEGDSDWAALARIAA
jgi:3-hydroxyisobutyrate dehydrogenase-like beta-hydroxyacid dehydrogenase